MSHPAFSDINFVNKNTEEMLPTERASSLNGDQIKF
jgi:hypothetical protein